VSQVRVRCQNLGQKQRRYLFGSKTKEVAFWVINKVCTCLGQKKGGTWTCGGYLDLLCHLYPTTRGVQSYSRIFSRSDFQEKKQPGNISCGPALLLPKWHQEFGSRFQETSRNLGIKAFFPDPLGPRLPWYFFSLPHMHVLTTAIQRPNAT
jgi:hypothetical protein